MLNRVAESLVPPSGGYVDEAIDQYILSIDEAASRMRAASSALTVLQRYVRESDDPNARERALAALSATSAKSAEIMQFASAHTQLANVEPDFPYYVVDKFNRPIRVKRRRDFPYFVPLAFTTFDMVTEPDWVVSDIPYMTWGIGFSRSIPLFENIDFGVSNLFTLPVIQWPWHASQPQRILETDDIAESPEQYWRRIRDDLQVYFSASLETLAPAIGVAYPTLVNLGKRKPHPSTARAVLRIRSLVKDFERSKGREAAIEWFSTEGLGLVTREGFDTLKRAALRSIYGRQRARGGVTTRRELDFDNSGTE